MLDESNIPNGHLSNTNAQAEAAKQQALRISAQHALQMAKSANVQKGQKTNGTTGKVNQGMQQMADGKLTFTGYHQARTVPEDAGISTQMGAEITIAGKPMNRYSFFSIHEQSDGHHYFSITYDHNLQRAESTPLADAFNMTGERILISIFPSNGMGGAAHAFSGVVTRAFKSFDHSPYGAIVVEGYSPTYLLDDKRTKSINSWYKGNISAIVKELTRPLQTYRTNIIASPKNVTGVDYLCQYKETPYQFLRRMAHDFGEFFFYDGMNLCYGKPKQEQPVKLVYGKDCENLRIGFDLKAVKHSHLVYHSATDKKEVKEAPASIEGLEGFAKEAYEKSRHTFTAGSVMPAPFRASRPDLLEVGVKSHAASEAADMYWARGSSTRQELKVGAVIDLYTSKVDGALQIGNESMGSFIITRVVHRMEAGDKYHNEFEAVPAGVPMLPVGDIEYPQAEAQPAVVTSNKDPDGQGRVRVKFYWSTSDGGISDWIKVLTPDAGGSEKVSKNRGLVTIPEEGDLVMVDFRYGQPDQPFVTGSMHAGPSAGGGGTGNNTKSLSSKSGHTLTLDDGGGITIIDKGKADSIVLDGANTITITAANNIILTNGKSTISMLDGKVSITASESVDIKAPAITVNGTKSVQVHSKTVNTQATTITMEALMMLSAACTGVINISAVGMATLAGAITAITAAKVQITGADVQTTAGEVTITGGEVKINNA